MKMQVRSVFVAALFTCCLFQLNTACTKICGNYWEGVHIHTYGAYNAPINGALWKDQCFTYTGHHVNRDGYNWKEIIYGSVRGWVASEYCYTRACV